MRRLLLSCLLVGLLSGTAYAACQEYPSSSGHWYPGTYAAPSLLAWDVTACIS